MKYLLRILIAAVIGVLFLQAITACGNGKQDKEVWTGELANGTIITEKGLSKILRDHWQWILEWRDAGGRANLSRAILSRADLMGANLTRADLRNANLRGPICAGPICSGPSCTTPT